MKVTQTVKAWLPSHSLMTPEELTDPDRVQLGYLSFTRLESDMTDCGYTLVGEASVTLDLPEHRQLIDAKVDSLRAEVKKVRAEAEAKANFLESQISNLLAIEHSPSSAATHYEDMARQADLEARN